MNFSDYEKVIVTKLKDQYGLEIVVNSNANIEFFPSLSFVFYGISINYHDKQIISSHTLKIPIDFKILFNIEDFFINNRLIFTDGDLFLSNYLYYILNYHDTKDDNYNVSAADVKKDSHSVADIRKILELSNFNLIFRPSNGDQVFILDNFTNGDEYIKIDHLVFEYVRDYLKFDGNISYNNFSESISFKFENADGNKNLYLNCNGTDFNLDLSISKSTSNEIKEHFPLYAFDKDNLSSGKLAISIPNLNRLITNLSGDNRNVIVSSRGDLEARKAVKQGSVQQAKKQDDNSVSDSPIKITSDIYLADEYIAAPNIIFTSDAIKNVRGYVNFYRLYNDDKDEDFVPEFDFKIIGDYIDLNKLLDSSGGEKSQLDITKLFTFVENRIFNDFDLINYPDLIGYMLINFNKITVGSGDITKFNFDYSFLPHLGTLNDLSMQMAGDATLKIVGSVSNNGIRPKFEGRMLFASKAALDFLKWANIDSYVSGDFLKKHMHFLYMQSDLSILPYNIQFLNLNLALGDETLLGGDLWFIKGGDGGISSYIYLNGNLIDLDSLNFDNRIFNYLVALYAADGDLTGELYTQYTNDNDWLRRMKGFKRITLNIDNLYLYNQILKDFYIAFSVAPNKVLIDEVNFESDLMTLNGQVNLTIPLFRPYISSVMVFKNLDLLKMLSVLPSSTIFYNSIPAAYGIKASINPSNFNFFSSSQYDGLLDLQILNMKAGSQDIRNISGKVILDSGDLSFKNFLFNIFNGSFQGSGDIVVGSALPRFYGSMRLLNFQAQDGLSSLFNFDKLSGYMSMSCSMKSNGYNIQQLVNNLNGAALFNGRALTYDGLQVDDIVNSLDDEASDVNTRVAKMKYYANYGSTPITELKGKMNIDRGVVSINDLEFKNIRVAGSMAAVYGLINHQLKSITEIDFIPYKDVRAISFSLKSEGEIDNFTTVADLKNLYTYIGYHDNADDAVTSQNYIPLRNRIMTIIQDGSAVPQKSQDAAVSNTAGVTGIPQRNVS